MTAPSRARRFRYEDYTIDPGSATLTCRYALDGIEFTETVTFDAGGDWTNPAVAAAARLVFLLAGVSYYKAGAPPVIELGDQPLSETERGFLRQYYVDGLGEFAYRLPESSPGMDRLDLSDLVIDAPITEHPTPPGRPAATGRRPLIPFGGGVDSILSVELLRPLADEPALFVVNRPGDRFEAIERPAAVTGLPVVRAERTIDPRVLRSKAMGFLNGHVPVTGIISAIAVMAAALGGHDAVVMSNEWSASSGTVEFDGRLLNHQYSKSEAFEAGFRSVLAERVGPTPDYFSLLRPFTELWIAQRFAELDGYFADFRSCNRSFHINPADRLTYWCGTCPKCCFIDLILAPYLPADVLRAVFRRRPAGMEPGVEPLENPSPGLRAEFDRLLALSADAKPWECVGDVDESRVAIELAGRRPDRAGSAPLQDLVDRVIPTGVEPDPLMRPMGRHFIPDRYARRDLLG